MEKYGFVYIWFDRKHKRYYVGAHWGKENDGYICSSPWMIKAYKRRPLDFKRRILERIYSNRKDTFIAEEKYLDSIKQEEFGKKYYNLRNIKGHWSTDEEKTKSLKQKISETATRNAQDPVYREKYLAGLATRDNKSSDPEVREKRRQSMMGKNVGKDNSKAIRISAEKRKGVPFSPERKIKLKETTHFKELNNMKIKCLHCDFVGNKGNVSRYHNDKCKYKLSV